MAEEVCRPQRHPEHPLPDQRPDRMLNQIWVALIDETAGQPIDQSDRLIHPAEQQRPGIRAHRPAVKSRHHPVVVLDTESCSCSALHSRLYMVFPGLSYNSSSQKKFLLISNLPDAPPFPWG